MPGKQKYIASLHKYIHCDNSDFPFSVKFDQRICIVPTTSYTGKNNKLFFNWESLHEGMELQENEQEKDEKHIGKLFRKTQR